MTDCSAAADTVADGKNGFVVRAEVGELEQAIRWMADNAMVKELSQAAYAGFDEEGSSADIYVKNLKRIYEEGNRE